MPKKIILPDIDEFIKFRLSHTNEEIAKHFNISKSVITRIINEFNIDHKNCTYRNSSIPNNLTSYQQEIISGCLLGDGSLSKIDKTGYNSIFAEEHSIKQYDIITHLFDNLMPFSSSICIRKPCTITICGKKANCSQSYKLQTIRHPIFTELEKKWYKRDDNGNYILNNSGKRIKVIPKDLILTPKIISYWYMGDGGNYPKQRRIVLHVNAFSIEECDFLLSKLKDVGIKTVIST